MSTITLRATKGSPLTNTEVDNNFSNLNTDKIEATYAGAMNSLTGGTAITTVSSTTGITAGAWKATVISPTYGGTGVAQASAASTITLGGALTMSGAYTFTGTLTGTTAVTFPTSGTLATTNGTFTGTWNGTVIAPNYGGTGVANAVGSTITLGGALTTSGAFATTLTVTAATNVTLPTTGTLATLAGTESLTNKKLGSLTSNGLVTTSGGDGTLSVTTTLGVGTGGTGTTTQFTAGSVVFAGASGVYTQDNSNLFWDDTNNRLGIGTTTPSVQLTLTNTTGEQAKFSNTTGSERLHFYSRIVGNTSRVESQNSDLQLYAYDSYGLGFGTLNTQRLYITSTGAFSFGATNTAYGTSGQVLTSNGNAAPSWQTSTAATTGKAIAMAMVFGG